MPVEHDDARPAKLESDQLLQTSLVSQVESDELINIPFDRYLLLRNIGEGAMGTVYEAQQHEPSRIVAVKVMKSKPASAAAEARFVRESGLLATLNHPHVAQLYDAGIHRHGVVTVPYCVMELVGGASSITAFAQAKKLSTKQRIELFLQVCGGVRHVHEHHILHCDLKPSNILVNASGQVKVIDFGVARSMQLDEHGGTIWSDASLMFGTPQYMSPEQVQGHNFELDARSDVYALGVILYELLCDRLPYKVDRTSSITAARSILESEPLAPHRVDRSLPRDLDMVLLKALSKDAERRYPNVAALEADLRRLLDGEPVVHESHRWYRTKRRAERWVARHRLFNAAVLVLTSATVCALASSVLEERWLGLKFDLFLTQSIGHVASAPLKHVLIAKITDHTDILGLAGAPPPLDEFGQIDKRFGRRTHGRMLTRLATAQVRPRAVTFDVFFPPHSNEEWDRDLADGIRAMGNVPVIVTTMGAASDTPEMNVAPALRRLVAVGGVLAVMRGDCPWIVDLVTSLPNGGIFPSLALMTASQCWHPGQKPAMEWRPDAVRLRYGNGIDRRVDVTSVGERDGSDLELGYRAGSLFAEYLVEIPNDEHLAASSIDYRQLFELSDANLRQRLDGKVLLIGDFRDRQDGPFKHPDGREMPGAILHAVAIERLLDDDALKRPRYLTLFGGYITSSALIVLAAAGLGAMVAWACVKRAALTRIAIYLGLAIAIAVAVVLSFRIGGYIYLPLAPMLCLVVAGELARLVYRARESTV